MPAYHNVALLPMKAHSARVSGKNFRNFAGKPLFRWILDTLLSVPEIDKVVINTDAREILEANGLVDSDRVLIRDRKPEICGDFVSMNLVLADDVAAIESETYLMTHTTKPLTQRRQHPRRDRGLSGRGGGGHVRQPVHSQQISDPVLPGRRIGGEP